jgi:hypothetical protein
MDAVMWDSVPVPARWKNIYLGFRCVKNAP